MILLPAVIVSSFTGPSTVLGCGVVELHGRYTYHRLGTLQHRDGPHRQLRIPAKSERHSVPRLLSSRCVVGRGSHSDHGKKTRLKITLDEMVKCIYSVLASKRACWPPMQMLPDQRHRKEISGIIHKPPFFSKTAPTPVSKATDYAIPMRRTKLTC
ncbi:hypothetical protein GE09DRAFT_328146 [Coniochaeta sp. 2T2.1]|nr:hypothetical protein GE09DRAFT_328146 [Coniochaeta sp. 2T2.1]